MNEKLSPEILQLISRLLGWPVDNQNHEWSWCDRLCGPNGQGLTLSLDRGRIKISGWFPYQYAPRKDLKITVAANRSPEIIVREIQRRFLSWYAVSYQEAMHLKEMAEAKDAMQKELALELAHACQGKASEDIPGQFSLPGHGRGQVWNDGSVLIDRLSCDFEKAVAIMKLLRD